MKRRRESKDTGKKKNVKRGSTSTSTDIDKPVIITTIDSFFNTSLSKSTLTWKQSSPTNNAVTSEHIHTQTSTVLSSDVCESKKKFQKHSLNIEDSTQLKFQISACTAEDKNTHLENKLESESNHEKEVSALLQNLDNHDSFPSIDEPILTRCESPLDVNDNTDTIQCPICDTLLSELNDLVFF